MISSFKVVEVGIVTDEVPQARGKIVSNLEEHQDSWKPLRTVLRPIPEACLQINATPNVIMGVSGVEKTGIEHALLPPDVAPSHGLSASLVVEHILNSAPGSLQCGPVVARPRGNR